MKNKLLLLFTIFPFLLNAQFNNCFTDQVHQQMLTENPSYNAKHQGIEQQIYKLKNSSDFSATKLMTQQTIPVVVHIIHQNGAENISDGQVFDAIQHLNEAFANTGIYDPSTGVDIEIDFCLGIRDPQNNASNGINRIESTLTNVTVETQDLELKALLQWNPLDYLNIWVVNEITSQSAGSGVAGYAFFPAAHGLLKDGIVIESNFFGASPDDSKVLVHEVGHYLGLYHTFEGACSNDDCQLNGDRICDTPPDQSTAPVDCGDEINTCSTDEDDTSTNNPFRPVALGGLGDQNDMYINYMDYGHLPCYSAFTQGQKERMKDALSTTRKSLLESFGCQAPCPFASFSASFSSNPASPVLAGELINFTNSSDPADTYDWSINGQSFSSNTNSNYTFNEEGLYTVNLQIQDTVNYCNSSFEQVIQVICEGEADFSVTSTEILPGETLDFTNTSTGNTGYEWFLDGELYSTDTDLSITFTEPGYYALYLVGTTPTCLNFSSTVTILVGTCTAEDKSEMHWYFGENAALDFNSGEPVLVPGSQLNSNEGTACISDDNGDLLFYTNGLDIWDATNTVMPNGSGLMGGENTSSWNQALIVPRPVHPNQYYIFTCDQLENASTNGIQYSIVDMTLNDGLGDVTDVKNVFLCPANTEAMSATYHDDGQRVWLIIPDHEAVNTYLIDADGIGPAISSSDASYNMDWGFTRFFKSGKRLILGQQNFNSPLMVIFDFDNLNGTFSNPVEINAGIQVWSFEVSPDDSKLYCSLGEEDNVTFNLYQFDLSLTTAAQISNSRTFIGGLTLFDRLLLGPNGKVYTTVFNSPNLGEINNPNELGTDCNYDATAVNLSPTTNILSLPKFMRGQRAYSEPSIPIVDLGTDQSICEGLTTVLDAGDGNYDFLWQDGSTNPTFTAWLPGTYWVTASNECGAVTDTITIALDTQEPIINCPPNLDTLVSLGTNEVLLNPALPNVINNCFYTIVNDYTNTNDASANYPAGTTTNLTWTLTDVNGNSSSCDMNITIDISTATTFLDNEIAVLMLYPNPSNGIFFLEENQNNINDIQLTVFDALGRKVYEEAVFLQGNTPIDLSGQATGIYFLHWSTSEGRGIFKLVLEE